MARYTYIILFFVLLVLPGCWSSTEDSKKRLLSIVCTTGILADTVSHISGEHANVIGLMGPGVDPHLYRAREGDMRKLSTADIIFYHGLHLEGKMGDLLTHLGEQKTTVAVSNSIPKHKLHASEFKDLYDPHVWHDIHLWMLAVKEIGSTLIDKDPEHAPYYEKRMFEYLTQLKQLHEYCLQRAQIIPKEKRILVTAHDAFEYFGNAYGFKVVGLQGISTDAEIGAKDIKDLVEFIIANKVSVLFIESSIPRKNIEAVQQAVSYKGWHVSIGPELFSDALGDPSTGADTYTSMIRHNIDAIVGEISKKVPHE